MSITSETIVRLKIISKRLSPKEITSLIGVSPDKSWKIDDIRPELGTVRRKIEIRERNNGWIIESGLPESSSLEAHINKLLQKLTPYIIQIKSVSEMIAKEEPESQQESAYDAGTVEFSCVQYVTDDYNPPLYFEKDIINKISAMGVSLDIDLYMLPSDDQVA